MNLTRGQLDRISRLGEQWSLLWDKRRRLWIAAEDAEDGEQIEEADLDVLLNRLAESAGQAGGASPMTGIPAG